MGAWDAVREHIGSERTLLGPRASWEWEHDPKHLLFVLARYKHAARLIGGARTVLELGCSEGIGARLLAENRESWRGIDLDAEALDVARETLPAPRFSVDLADAVGFEADGPYDAVVSLDVIEHIEPQQTREFIEGAAGALREGGVCVIGTPNATARAYQSEASRLGHINHFDGDLLRINMAPHFKHVTMFGMNDEILTTGFLPMAHYLMAVGVGPR